LKQYIKYNGCEKEEYALSASREDCPQAERQFRKDDAEGSF
jgi:hypothetical protein